LRGPFPKRGREIRIEYDTGWAWNIGQGGKGIAGGGAGGPISEFKFRSSVICSGGGGLRCDGGLFPNLPSPVNRGSADPRGFPRTGGGPGPGLQAPGPSPYGLRGPVFVIGLPGPVAKKAGGGEC